MRRLLLFSLLSGLLILGMAGCDHDALAPGADLGTGASPDLLESSDPDLAHASDLGLVLNQELLFVSGRLTINDKTPTKQESCTENRGVISFVDPAHRDTIFSTRIPCASEDFSWSLQVAPGTYDVIVAGVASPDAPVNQFVAAPNLVVGSALVDLVLDLPIHQLSGTVTVNAAAPTRNDALCPANDVLAGVQFREKTGRYWFISEIRCGAPDFSWTAKLPTGHYEIFVSLTPESVGHGLNLLAADQPGHRVAADFYVGSDASGVILDEIAHTVSGTVTVNGEKPVTNGVPCTGSDQLAVLTFFDPLSGQRFPYYFDCASTDFAWSVALPPGTYTVSLAAGSSASKFALGMVNGKTTIEPSLAVSGARSNVVLNQVAYPVSGKVTVGGKKPTKSLNGCLSSTSIAWIWFRDEGSDYSTYASIDCDTQDFSFSTLLPPGTYDAFVYADPAANLATYEVKVQSSLAVAGPVTDLILDEGAELAKRHTVSGKLLLNGAAPPVPTCATPDMTGVEVLFYEKQTNAHEIVALDCKDNDDFSWSTTLPPGTYEVRVKGSYLPQYNLQFSTAAYIANPALVVGGDLTGVMLDQVVRKVDGVVQVNGAQPALNDVACLGHKSLAQISFFDLEQGYYAYTSIDCDKTDFSFSLPLPSGAYDVYLSRGIDGETFDVGVVGSSTRVMSGYLVP